MINYLRSVFINFYYISSYVCNTIKKTGFNTCILWTKQVITNQIGKKIIEMHHKYYVINYPYGIKWYKIIVPRNRSPCIIDTIHDENDNNITNDILQYMGPCHNFHGKEMTPNLLGYSELHIINIYGEKVVYKNNDIIDIN